MFFAAQTDDFLAKRDDINGGIPPPEPSPSDGDDLF
jgi:hypothetical protein